MLNNDIPYLFLHHITISIYLNHFLWCDGPIYMIFTFAKLICFYENRFIIEESSDPAFRKYIDER